MSKTMEVTIKTTVEVGDVERDVDLKFMCHPGEAPSRTSPGGPPEAEYLSCVFADTGADATASVDPHDFEEQALEEAAEIEGGEADAAAEAKYQARRDGD